MEICFFWEMARSAVQITGVNTEAEEGINILDQFYHCCDSCAWLGAFERSPEFSLEILLFAPGLTVSIYSVSILSLENTQD